MGWVLTNQNVGKEKRNTKHATRPGLVKAPPATEATVLWGVVGGGINWLKMMQATIILDHWMMIPLSGSGDNKKMTG